MTHTIVEEHPGPRFLDRLEQAFADARPEALGEGEETLQYAASVVSLTAHEMEVLRRGLLAYYLLFVEPALELRGGTPARRREAARLQMLALMHWRSVDTLLDLDSMQINTYRHRIIATQASCHIRDGAHALGIDWRGEAGRRYLAFHVPHYGLVLGENPPGRRILDAFLEEHFVVDPDARMSFLHFVPQSVLGVGDAELSWYRFYTAVVSLDDDLDDALADALAARPTPTVRVLQRIGAFDGGRTTAFPMYLRFLQDFLIRQLDACIVLADRHDYTAAQIVLRVVRESVAQKNC